MSNTEKPIKDIWKADYQHKKSAYWDFHLFLNYKSDADIIEFLKGLNKNRGASEFVREAIREAVEGQNKTSSH